MPEDDAPLLLQLLDMPVDEALLERFSPQERKVRTFALLRHLVLHDCQQRPLVLVVENLHWADATSEEWLTALVEHLTGAAILLLVTYRPGYRPPWLGQSVATQLALPHLLPEDSRAVVQSVLQTTLLPEPLLQAIVTKAAGNPFFLEELTWAVIEQSPHPAVPGIPDTIQAVLAARIDRLPPEEKHLLQTAAVIGPEIAMLLLQAIAEIPAEALHRSLAHLQVAEFLYETRLFPDLVYTFKHALTHEVAYGSLLQERRRALHAQIVEVLETLYPARLAEQVERLAHHALRGEVWDKALMYCRQAGEKAMARSAHREAVVYYEQALDALQHLPTQHDTRAQAIDLRLALRSALRPIGDSGRALTYLREAESLAMACDDSSRLGQVSAFLSVHFYYMGEHSQAITAAQRARGLATAGGDIVLQALANQYLGVAYQAQGNYRQAIDCFGQTVVALDGGRRCERFGQIFLPAVLTRAWLAWCHTELGMFTESRALGEEGLQIAKAAAHPSSLMFAYWGVGLPFLRQGDLYMAVPLLERAMSICQEADLSIFFPDMAPALGAAYTLAGRVADAVPLLMQAMEQTIAMNMQGLQALCSLPLGESQMLAGRLKDAHALAERTLILARAHQERSNEAYALRLLGEIAARRDPPAVEPAEVHYQQALILAEALDMRPLVAHCYFGLGTLYARIGRPEQARTALSTAVELYCTMEMTFWLSQVEAVLTQP
jgi:tetratricopeptide (TPR) repeat protein